MHLDLAGGRQLNGSYRAKTRFEALLEWPETSGLLTLKTYGTGQESRAVALDWNAWNTDADVDGVRELMESALVKLAE